MHQLKSSYNSPFKDSYSHPIHTCFVMIASNDKFCWFYLGFTEPSFVRNVEYSTNSRGSLTPRPSFI